MVAMWYMVFGLILSGVNVVVGIIMLLSVVLHCCVMTAVYCIVILTYYRPYKLAVPKGNLSTPIC